MRKPVAGFVRRVLLQDIAHIYLPYTHLLSGGIRDISILVFVQIKKDVTRGNIRR